MRDNQGRPGEARTKTRTRLAMPLALLVACSLLATFASAASASNYDMRGEWSVELKGANPSNPPASDTDVITRMEASGEYSGNASLDGGALAGPVTGTVSGTETSISMVGKTPAGVITFAAEKLQINTAENKFSGPGAYYSAGHQLIETGEIICVRIKTHQEVVEREEREKKEAEEKQARSNVRGEWELTLKAGPYEIKGIALIANEANSKNEFSTTNIKFEVEVTGLFKGTLEGEKATVELSNKAGTGIPAAYFNSSTISVSSSSDPASMSGTGKVIVPEYGIETTGEMKATRIHTYTEVTEREAKEKAQHEKEAKEAQEAQEAKEAKEAQEAKEKAERAAKEAEEATAKRAREEREAQERIEAASKVATPPGSKPVETLTLLAAVPSGKTLTATGGGTLPLALTNPNAFAIHGRVTLVALLAGHPGKHHAPRQLTLGTASFSIAAHASGTVSVKLAHAGLAALKHSHTLHITVTVTSESTGVASVSKKYALILHAHHGKG